VRIVVSAILTGLILSVVQAGNAQGILEGIRKKIEKTQAKIDEKVRGGQPSAGEKIGGTQPSAGSGQPTVQGGAMPRARTPGRTPAAQDQAAYDRAMAGVAALRDDAGKDGINAMIHAHASSLLGHLTATRTASDHDAERQWIGVLTSTTNISVSIGQPGAVGAERWPAVCADLKNIIERSMSAAGRQSSSMCSTETQVPADSAAQHPAAPTQVALPNVAQSVASSSAGDLMSLTQEFVNRAVVLEICARGSVSSVRSTLQSFLEVWSSQSVAQALGMFDRQYSLLSSALRRSDCRTPEHENKLKTSAFLLDEQKRRYTTAIESSRASMKIREAASAAPALDNAGLQARLQQAPPETRDYLAREFALYQAIRADDRLRVFHSQNCPLRNRELVGLPPTPGCQHRLLRSNGRLHKTRFMRHPLLPLPNRPRSRPARAKGGSGHHRGFGSRHA
jgi:hypothetical protein